MSSSYVMRPARLDDFDILMQLAEESGPGFTSLPVHEPIIRERLEKSERGLEKAEMLNTDAMRTVERGLRAISNRLEETERRAEEVAKQR